MIYDANMLIGVCVGVCVVLVHVFVCDQDFFSVSFSRSFVTCRKFHLNDKRRLDTKNHRCSSQIQMALKNKTNVDIRMQSVC